MGCRQIVRNDLILSSTLPNIVYTSDSLEPILSHLSTRVVDVITNGNGVQHLRHLLRFLVVWKERPPSLTPMAYQWCSAVSKVVRKLVQVENYTGLRDCLVHPAVELERNFPQVGSGCGLALLDDTSHTHKFPRGLTLREYKGLLSMILNVGRFKLNRIKIPQRDYGHGGKQWCFKQSEPISFSVDGRPGLNLGDALRREFEGLDGRDDRVLQDAAGAISCRFLVGSSGFHKLFGIDSVHPQFPGYPDNDGSYQVWLLRLLYFHILTPRGKITTLDWTKRRLPITRSKLAYEVAKKVKRYLCCLAVRLCLDWFSF